MEFSLLGLLVLLHVTFAALWFGGVLYQVIMIGRILMKAGPAATGFMLTMANLGGVGKYFALNGALTILFGAILYGMEMNDGSLETFSGRGLWLTLGAIMAIATYLHGLSSNMPTEKKFIAVALGVKNGQPTPDQGKQMAMLGEKMGKAGFTAVLMLVTSMTLMLMNRVLV